MIETVTPLYRDWGFWAAIAAFLAIVLSQVPPLRLILRRAAVSLEVYSRIYLTHKVGNPNAQLHLIVTNVGGRPIRCTGLSLTFKRDAKQVANLPAMSFLPDPTEDKSVIFTRLSLKPGEEWAYVVTFFNPFSRADEKKYREAERQIKKDVNAKLAAQGEGDPKPSELVEADPATVTPFTEMFDEKFVWRAGEYEVQVNVHVDPEGASLSRSFRSTLFESDEETLAGSRADFRYGDGVYWNSGKHSGAIVNLVEA